MDQGTRELIRFRQQLVFLAMLAALLLLLA
jgi:hypothetical protein